MLNILAQKRQVHDMIAALAAAIALIVLPGCAPVSLSDHETAQQTEPTQTGQLQITSQSWQLAAQNVAYSIFTPTYVPSDLTASWPSYDQQTGVVVQHYSLANEPSALIIIQRSLSSAPSEVPGISVQIGDAIGSYWKKEEHHWLFVDRSNTRIELQAVPHIGKDELILIAQSMASVPLP